MADFTRDFSKCTIKGCDNTITEVCMICNRYVCKNHTNPQKDKKNQTTMVCSEFPDCSWRIL